MRSSKELIYDITKSKVHDKKWWFDLKQEVVDFFNSNASKREKDEVAQYSEMLLMVCKGFEYEEQKDRDDNKDNFRAV